MLTTQNVYRHARCSYVRVCGAYSFPVADLDLAALHFRRLNIRVQVWLQMCRSSR